MKFTPIYYVCIACPTITRTKEMVDKYVERGAKAFQIDMPSMDPFAETEFVKKMMKESLKSGITYRDYMDGIRDIRAKHQDLEIHIVVYDDVITSIGLQEFCDFVEEVKAASIMVPGISTQHFIYAAGRGIKIFRSIIHEMPEELVLAATMAADDDYICLRNRKPGEEDKPGYDTWEKKYRYIRDRGVKGNCYSVFGIKTKDELAKVKEAGGRGAIIGNVLMHLWDDEESLWSLFEEFQSLAE